MSFASKSFSFLQRDAFLFITNIVTSIFVARYLGPTLLGIWVIINLIPSYADLFFRTKADAAAVYYLGQKKYEINEVVYALNMLAIISSLLIIIPIVVFNHWFISMLFDQPKENVSLYIYIILLQIPLNFIFSNYQYLHVFKEDVRSINIMTVSKALISAAIILFVLIVFKEGLFGVSLGTTLGAFVAVIIGYVRLKYPRKSVRSINLTLIKDLLRYGFKLYVGNLFSHINLYASQLIVIAYCAPAQVAFFSIAQQMGQLVNKLSDAMGVFLFPRISKETDQGVSANLASKAYRVTLVILLPVLIFAPLLFQPVLSILYGKSYSPVVYPFFIILPGLVLGAATSNLSMFFQGIGRADLVAKISFIPLVVQVSLGFLLIPWFGIIGAAISFLFSLLATSATQMIIFNKRQSEKSRGSLIIRKEDFMLVKQFIFDQFYRLGSLVQ